MIDQIGQEPKKRGGARPGAGRRRNKSEGAPRKALAGEILDGLVLSESEWEAKGHPRKEGQACGCEKCRWRRDCQLPGAEGRNARKYLWDRRDGRPPLHGNSDDGPDPLLDLIAEFRKQYSQTKPGDDA